INYIDAMTTSRPWDAIIHNHLFKKNIAIPQPKEPPLRVDFIGGYVKEPQIGLHHWVVSFDFDALYPTILSQHNISPETFEGKVDSFSVEWCLTHMNGPTHGEGTCTANGCLFRTDKKGFIPEIVDEYIQERVNVKNKMLQLKKDDPKSPEIEALDHYQQALKILNNGLYGSLGQKHFRWFDLRLAEAVTSTAQVCTRYVEQQLNIYLNKVLKTDGEDYVVAADTDSVYLIFGKLVEALGAQGKSPSDITELVDKICKAKFQPFIERCCLELCKSFNVLDPKLKMKREAICEKAIWRAAKQYILNIWDLEGVRYKKPILKYKGIEVVRSSTPMVCRDNLKKCLSIIMNKTESDLQKFIKQFYNEYKKM
ncbi:MAG TPA: DNA polymerase domain-containing protein, partial [Methylomirabilota bacterium]|nr:DNA polymerase domain-containing protein [Methylomirabilota bacterium]